jgi:putative tryptophan/tyrosine transport system substrate-binding protein
MRRREFIAGLGSAVAWPLAARAQQPAMPVIGWLSSGTPEASAILLADFRKGLNETGYVEGRNVAVEYRWAHDEYDRLPELAADLVRRQVAVLVAFDTTRAALAAKAATTSIPIVFAMGGDPVRGGVLASLNQPGSNVTGVSSMNVELGAKRFGLLNELLPGTTRFAVLVNPTEIVAESIITDMRTAASAIGRQIEVFTAGTSRDIDSIFSSLVQKRVEALVVTPSSLFNSRRVQLVTLAAYHRVPASYYIREFTVAGGLMSYGGNISFATSPTKLAAEPVRTSPPNSAIRAFTPGPSRIALISRLSRSTVSDGVFLGAAMPNHMLASKPAR